MKVYCWNCGESPPWKNLKGVKLKLVKCPACGVEGLRKRPPQVADGWAPPPGYIGGILGRGGALGCPSLPVNSARERLHLLRTAARAATVHAEAARKQVRATRTLANAARNAALALEIIGGKLDMLYAGLNCLVEQGARRERPVEDAELRRNIPPAAPVFHTAETKGLVGDVTLRERVAHNPRRGDSIVDHDGESREVVNTENGIVWLSQLGKGWSTSEAWARHVGKAATVHGSPLAGDETTSGADAILAQEPPPAEGVKP